MRLMILEICMAIAALVFLAMLAATVRHHQQGSSRIKRPPLLAEYLWATIPWLMIIACAMPAAWKVVASARAQPDAAPVAAVLAPASQAFLSKPAVVIDQQEREQR